jgi:TRAP-type C4-dicarboxylate transport system permease small subunit
MSNLTPSPILEWLTVLGYTAIATFVTWQVITRSSKR